MTGTMRRLAIFACALAIYALGIAVRWGVLAVQEARNGGMPFTMESALAFHYGEMAGRSSLPSIDARVAGPEGMPPRASLNLAATVFWAKVFTSAQDLWRGLGFYPLQRFYQNITAVVFCTGVLVLFGCAWVLTGRLVLAALGALGYAVLIPAVLRSTGQEWMGENFALPLIWLHFLCTLLALRAHAASRKIAFYVWTAFSAITLALAWVVWDMVQVYLLIWVVVSAAMLWKTFGNNATRFYALAFGLALTAVALADTYLRAHGAWASPPLCLLAALIVALFGVSKPGWRGLGIFALAATVFYGLSRLNLLTGDSYGHFTLLFGYKLKFLNIKPDNPALLPYEVRALWVPALHSATWERLRNYFGPAALLWLGTLIVLGWKWVCQTASPAEKAITAMGVFFAVLSILFVRMEVFWIFFLPLMLVLATPKPRWVTPAWIAAVTLSFFVQAHALVVQSPYLGRDVDYRALNDVVRWVQNNTPEDATVLASYSLSPSFAAYANRGIILQPKYETPAFREKIHRFEQALMAEQEGAFFSLCEKWGVRYYVHSKGFYADHSVNSFRYLVGSPQPSRNTNLVKFELNPRFLNRFRLLYQNEKYLVYRVVGTDDLRKSRFCLNMGRACIAKGFPQRALHWCYRALALYPGENRARFLAVKSYSTMGDVAGARQEATRLFERMQISKMRDPFAQPVR